MLGLLIALTYLAQMNVINVIYVRTAYISSRLFKEMYTTYILKRESELEEVRRC